MAQSPRVVRLRESDLPFSCPPPKTPGWNLHPRVFLPVNEKTPKAACPYCGTIYTLVANTPPSVTE